MPGSAVVVFLGPSLSKERAQELLKADIRPPAKRGEIYRAAREGADIICLIDGVFFQECSVAHKEILDALEAVFRILTHQRIQPGSVPAIDGMWNAVCHADTQVGFHPHGAGPVHG